MIIDTHFKEKKDKQLSDCLSDVLFNGNDCNFIWF